MGYSTSFKGSLKFANEPTAKQLAVLVPLFGDTIKTSDGTHYAQFELTPEFDGIQWDGSEKFYGAAEVVNALTDRMRETWPDFAFTGELTAAGEDPDDRWRLVMKDGVATKVEMPAVGQQIKCPHCGRKFRLGEEEE